MSTNNNRLEYLDSLRGIAMLNVIYFHICLYLLGESTAINDSLDRWQMPVFFFITGNFAFSPVYDKPLIKKRMKTRLVEQLYPTSIIWLIFIGCSWLLSEYPFKDHLLHGIYDPAKVGYWFTFSLVQVFIAYALFAYILSYFKISVKRQTAVYLMVIVIFGILSLMTFDDTAMSGTLRKIWNVLSLGKTVKLVAFFFFGALVRMHWNAVGSIMRRYWFAALSLAVFAATSFFSSAEAADSAIIYLISRISGLFFMVSLFMCLEKYVSRATPVGRYLQRLGRNTLPIYLFHFFILLLIPYFINDLSGVLRQLSVNPVIEFISFTIISIIFAEITLAIETLLNTVPRLHRVIFAK